LTMLSNVLAVFLVLNAIVGASSVTFATNFFSNEITMEKTIIIDLNINELSTLSRTSGTPSSAWELKETGRCEEAFDEPKASVHLGWTIYKLNDIIPAKDWYRIDFTFQQKIKEYKQTNERCGYYTYKRGLKVDIGKYDDLLHDLEIYDWGPTTSEGSTTTGYTIGAGLSGSTPGFDASYSYSWSSPDVDTIDDTDTVDEYVKWTEKFRGPENYWKWPWYDGACQAARSSFLSHPSVIMELQIPFTGFKVYVEVYWKIRNDELTCYILWLEIATTTWTIEGKGNLYCDYKW
jgi:hypothetical protein